MPPGGLVAYPCEVDILPTAPPILTPGDIRPEDRFGFIGDIFFPATSTEDCRSLGPAVGADPEPNLRLELDRDVEIWCADPSAVDDIWVWEGEEKWTEETEPNSPSAWRRRDFSCLAWTARKSAISILISS